MGTDPVESAESRRYYRAPELVVDRDMYGPAVDMWSYGCILMELAIGKPPFLGANNTMMVRPSAPRPCTAHACQCHRPAAAQHGGRSVCVDRPVGKPDQTRPAAVRHTSLRRRQYSGGTHSLLGRDGCAKHRTSRRFVLGPVRTGTVPLRLPVSRFWLHRLHVPHKPCALGCGSASHRLPPSGQARLCSLQCQPTNG